MPDASPSDSEEIPQPISITSVSGGVNLDAQRDVNISGDVVGHDKIIGYTVEQVSSLLTQISSTFQPKPFDGRCPYLGLDAFSEDDADRFFGRETLVNELVVRVKESRFVVIAGPSGSGKSSLVRAGLIHALKQGALPNGDRWLYTTLTPGRDPIESLALAMSRLAKSPDAGKYLRAHSAEPGALHEFAESQLSDRKDQRTVIFVDQFEEVFTQVSKEDERTAFLNLLTHAATHENGRVTVLFALRSDFVSNCATYPQLNALLNQQFMQVGAMQPAELVSAIARPALPVGLRIEPDLVAQIVNDMQDEPGALPLMQFALKDLFDAQQAKGDLIALTLNDYLARGGLRKALERHADAAFAELSEDEQQLARTIFSGLVEIGRGTQDTRRTALFDELVPATIEVTQVNAVVQKLADARLITTNETGNQDTVTIAHERLIEAWPWLRKLISENREAIALQNQIVEDAQEWDEQRRDASYLYSGARLATAREQLAANKIVLGGLAQAFIDAGVEARESATQRERARQQQEIRRLQTRNRIITAVGLLALAAMLVALFFGVQANRNAESADRNAVTAQAASTQAVEQKATAEGAARLAQARYLIAQGQTIFENDPLLGIHLALEGLLLIPSSDSATLRQAARSIADLSKWGRVSNLGPNVQAIYPSPDGSTLIVDYASKPGELVRVADGTHVVLTALHPRATFDSGLTGDYFSVEYSDAATGAELRRTRDGALLATYDTRYYQAIKFSPSGAYFVVIYTSKAPSELRRTVDGSLVATLTGDASCVDCVTFSPNRDAAFIAVHYIDGHPSELRQTANGALITTLNGAIMKDAIPRGIQSVSFSPDPDATYLVVNSVDAPNELRRSRNGALIPLKGKFDSISYSPDPNATYFVINYLDGPSELRYTANAELVVTLRDALSGWTFSPDPKVSYFIATYRDGTSELLHTNDGGLIAPLSSTVWTSFFSSDLNASYLVIHYANAADELRQTSNGNIVARFDDPVQEVSYSSDPTSDFGAVVFTNSTIGLYRLSNGDLISKYSYAAPSKVTFLPEPASNLFIIHYSLLYNELRQTRDGALVKSFSDGFSEIWSPTRSIPYYIAKNFGERGEVYSLVDSSLVISLTSTISALSFSSDQLAAYFIVTYLDGTSELWKWGMAPYRLAEFGLGMKGYHFSPDNKRLAIWYTDGRAYILDINWLEAMNGDPSLLTPNELVKLSCEGPLASGFLDTTLLKPFLGDSPPQACR